MITGAQIRAARGGLKWTLERLALESGVSRNTIKRMEETDGVVPVRVPTVMKVFEAFRAQGFQFETTHDGWFVIISPYGKIYVKDRTLTLAQQ